MVSVKLYNEDCLEVMQSLIDDGVKVDMVLTDPPYGTTRCNWDNVIPFDEMWNCINKLSKPTTPTLLFGTQPFLSELIHSNIKNFKYNLIWDKKCVSNPLFSKKRPLRVHEEIAVFYKKQPYYNPQKIPREGKPYNRISDNAKKIKESNTQMLNSHYTSHYYVDDGTRYPKSIISQFPSQMEECANNKRVHPTQKPVALLKWLIQNYTKEDDVVLDFTMGSGSTGVACLNTNRDFIGIELEKKYYDIANERLKNYQTRLI